MRPSFFHHLHPPTIPAAQARWRHTLGAGGASFFLLLILAITGILEMFYYVPNPAEAALSVQTLTYLVPFGGFIRNVHYWAAQGLLVVTTIHLFRVVFTGAYNRPRRFNYLMGLALLVLALMLDFTGYILRWDVNICWPLVTGTNLIKTVPLVGAALYRVATGGGTACSTALLRFYTWHIFGLVLPIIFLGGWHAFRVRRDGGIAVPPSAIRTDTARLSRNELVRREGAAMLLLSVILIAFAVFFPAPLGAAMTGSPTLTGETRAPWFFLWVQQMLKWGDPFWWGVFVPLSVLALLAAFPYFFPKPADAEVGKWFPKSNRLAQITVSLVGGTILVLSLLNC
ncbi:MAG: cytochrome b N-terminal domain-containing protein [Anaerolineales bacterium]|nr:cytochrome b N-terminal domain-containing protein [Anaerolineales bacterium]